MCFWEDGSQLVGPPSVVNRMSLPTARQNFARWGAISEDARDAVLPDGPARYVRA